MLLSQGSFMIDLRVIDPCIYLYARIVIIIFLRGLYFRLARPGYSIVP